MAEGKRKISIIGAGFVGSTIAYALMNSGIATEICIYDINMDKALGEVMDLVHGTSFVKPVNIYAGGVSETKDSDIVVITAGAGQKPGETRLDLIDKNYKIFKGFIPDIAKESPNAILLVVSNPADILAYITYKLSGFPKERVIGSGTVLDTSRLKYILGKYFEVNNSNIHGYVVGEHGDSSVVTWSSASVGAVDMDVYAKQVDLPWDDEIKQVIGSDVVNAAYEIISRKKATFFAIGLSVNRIVEAIFRNENSVLTVSSLFEGQYGIDEMYLAIPTILNRKGAVRVIEIPLNEEEKGKLVSSAKILKEHFAKCNI
ncbi:MAG: L-lactate dehydrogenase [Clostridiaceae bacterium]|nr:L-lactate dehydrogenase [Clostridiaceae bacterium]